MTKLYTPANGTEGEVFFENWCCHCSRDKAMREGADFDDCDDNELCEIIAAGFRGPVKEWIWGEDGQPCCTAFVEHPKPIPFVDTLTKQLFENI